MLAQPAAKLIINKPDFFVPSVLVICTKFIIFQNSFCEDLSRGYILVFIADCEFGVYEDNFQQRVFESDVFRDILK
jgi:hypothetical protein